MRAPWALAAACSLQPLPVDGTTACGNGELVALLAPGPARPCPERPLRGPLGAAERGSPLGELPLSAYLARCDPSLGRILAISVLTRAHFSDICLIMGAF